MSGIAQGKTYVYYTLVDERTAGASTLRRVLDKIYGGSPVRLLAHFVERAPLSAEDVRRIRALLAGAPPRPPEAPPNDAFGHCDRSVRFPLRRDNTTPDHFGLRR